MIRKMSEGKKCVDLEDIASKLHLHKLRLHPMHISAKTRFVGQLETLIQDTDVMDKDRSASSLRSKLHLHKIEADVETLTHSWTRLIYAALVGFYQNTSYESKPYFPSLKELEMKGKLKIHYAEDGRLGYEFAAEGRLKPIIFCLEPHNNSSNAVFSVNYFHTAEKFYEGKYPSNELILKAYTARKGMKKEHAIRDYVVSNVIHYALYLIKSAKLGHNFYGNVIPIQKCLLLEEENLLGAINIMKKYPVKDGLSRTSALFELNANPFWIFGAIHDFSEQILGMKNKKGKPYLSADNIELSEENLSEKINSVKNLLNGENFLSVYGQLLEEIDATLPKLFIPGKFHFDDILLLGKAVNEMPQLVNKVDRQFGIPHDFESAYIGNPFGLMFPIIEDIRGVIEKSFSKNGQNRVYFNLDEDYQIANVLGMALSLPAYIKNRIQNPVNASEFQYFYDYYSVLYHLETANVYLDLVLKNKGELSSDYKRDDNDALRNIVFSQRGAIHLETASKRLEKLSDLSNYKGLPKKSMVYRIHCNIAQLQSLYDSEITYPQEFEEGISIMEELRKHSKTNP